MRFYHQAIVFGLIYLTATSLFALTEQPFTSSEHLIIGNQIVLRFSEHDQGKKGVKIPITNNLQLTYGEIITLGDYFGIVNHPISMGKSDQEKRAIFLEAFNSITINQEAINQIAKILALIYEEQHLVNAAIENNESIDEVYAKLGHKFDIKYNCITGGGCHEATWLVKQGRYIKLLKTNYDHFGDYAWTAYSVGHKLALEIAAAAGATKDINKLALAYAMNGYASHFLTDRFATGHIRTPRFALPQNTTPGVIGSILASYMHAEENLFGLNVYNLNGDKWIAYGDKSYLKPSAIKHRAMVLTAVQQSVDEVFSAYVMKKVNAEDKVKKYIPYTDENLDNPTNTNIAALFYWDNTDQKLYRRKNLNAPYSREWKTNWWGWTTLLSLQASRGLPQLDQARLADSVLRKQALEKGLITDPSLVGYVRKNEKK